MGPLKLTKGLEFRALLDTHLAVLDPEIKV